MTTAADQEREDAIRAAFDSASDRMPGVSLDQFRAATADCAVTPVRVDGRIVGAILVSGAEVHACIRPEGFRRWVSKRLMRVLDSVVATHGYAVTRVRESNGAALGFVRRLGFLTVIDNSGGTLVLRKG